MPTAYVTRHLPGDALGRLGREVRFRMNPEDRPATREEIAEGLKGVDGLICLLTDHIDAALMDLSPRLKVIANYAVGYDNVDVKAATARGIAVTNTPGVLTETTADFAFSLLMASARRIPEADRFTKRGLYAGWAPELMLGCDIHGKKLGIVGLGRIGTAVARRAKGFGMKVLYYDAVRNPEAEALAGIVFTPLGELLADSDFISVHVPLLPATRHLIGERELRGMKRSAHIVNTSRGPVIDEKALARALKEGWIAGAALDVYENEPSIEPELMKLENAILAPHISSASLETRSKMAEMAVDNLLAGLGGRRPQNIVNPEVLDRGRGESGV